jgi:hypothetical protein
MYACSYFHSRKKFSISIFYSLSPSISCAEVCCNVHAIIGMLQYKFSVMEKAHSVVRKIRLSGNVHDNNLVFLMREILMKLLYIRSFHFEICDRVMHALSHWVMAYRSLDTRN